MKQIRILGTGCPKCAKLAETADAAAGELGIEYEIEKVAEIEKIMQYGVMMTPALVVNGEVKASGRVPAVDEMKQLLA